MVLLLAAVLFINYVDRGALPMAAHHIQEDLHLTYRQLGMLGSAFFWTYALAQVPMGWLAERYGAHRVLAYGLATWALATVLVGVVSGFVMLFILRLLLGLGESVGFPCTSKILASSVPNQSLGTANGIIAFAYLLGPVAGTFFGGVLMAEFGWRTAFVVFGAVSLLWLLPWARWGAQRPARAATQEVDSTQIATNGMILRQLSLWGTALGHFSSNYTFYFMLSWLPFYLVHERGFSDLEMTRFVSVAYFVNAVFAMGGGWAIDRYIRRGGATNFIYKLVMGGCAFGFIICMLCTAVGPRPVALASIFAYQVLCGLQSPGVFAISQIIAGPAAAGRWVGIQNTIGNLAGIVAPALTGFLLDWTGGHFTLPFVMAAAVGVVGFVGYVFMIPKVAELDWEAQTAGRSSIASTRLG
ncbi:MAG: transporter, family, D-galactonate transporter [Gammaproteobacteria bacterium]|nr:transporter, family, D-galactonate transporter [Gammaproteobacteria bacterium]